MPGRAGGGWKLGPAHETPHGSQLRCPPSVEATPLRRRKLLASPRRCVGGTGQGGLCRHTYRGLRLREGKKTPRVS